MIKKPVIRCSSLDRLLNCAGSRTIIDKIAAATVDVGAPEGDEMTWRGNWCHYESALRLIRDHGAIGMPDAPVLPADWTPSDWDRRSAEWYVSNVLLLTPEDHAIYVEKRVTMEFDRFILTGQLDVYTIDGRAIDCTIDDQKTGPNKVDHAEENWQLLGYACLLKHEHPTLQRGKVRIFQRDADESITEADIDTFDGIAAYLEGEINKALDAAYELNSGYKQCRLCPVIFLPCPCVRAELKAMKMKLTPEEVDRLELVPDLKTLAAVAADGRAVRGPIDKLLERLKERIEQEGPVTLADGTVVSITTEAGKRSIKHTHTAYLAVVDKLGADVAWETLLMSLSELEDQLVDKAGMKRTSKTGESAKSWINFRLGHLIERSTTKKLMFK